MKEEGTRFKIKNYSKYEGLGKDNSFQVGLIMTGLGAAAMVLGLVKGNSPLSAMAGGFTGVGIINTINAIKNKVRFNEEEHVKWIEKHENLRKKLERFQQEAQNTETDQTEHTMRR